MKNRSVLFYPIRIENVILFSIFYFFAHRVQAQYIPSSPMCEGISQQECLELHIAEADVVFEGTVLNSYKYFDSLSMHHRIYTCYQVDKVFKGEELGDTLACIVDETVYFKPFVNWFQKLEHREFKASMGPSKIGSVKIFLGRQILSENPNGSIVKNVTEFTRRYPLNYQLDKYLDFPEGKENTVMYLPDTNGKTLYFETADEVYNFIMNITTKTYLDKTDKKIEKKPYKQKKTGSTNTNESIERGNNLSPIITSFSQHIPGGDDSILEIFGEEFGSIPGEIWFSSTHNPTDMDKKVLDNFDMSFSTK